MKHKEERTKEKGFRVKGEIYLEVESYRGGLRKERTHGWNGRPRLIDERQICWIVMNIINNFITHK